MGLTNKLKIAGWTAAYWLNRFEGAFCEEGMGECSTKVREEYRKSVMPQIEMASSKITKRIGELYFLEGDTERAEVYFERSDFYRCVSEGKPVRNPTSVPIPYLVVDGDRFIRPDGQKYNFGTESTGPQ
ncbi:MAG: hypothetical protein WCI72_05745 [archaeon]